MSDTEPEPEPERETLNEALTRMRAGELPPHMASGGIL